MTWTGCNGQMCARDCGPGHSATLWVPCNFAVGHGHHVTLVDEEIAEITAALAKLDVVLCKNCGCSITRLSYSAHHSPNGWSHWGPRGEGVACRTAMLTSAQPPDGRWKLPAELSEFMAAATEVWREIDRLEAEPEGYHPTRMSVELRLAERAAWERYRAILDTP